MPYTEGADLAGKVVSKDENTYLIVPNGVTLKGDGLNDLGAEPRTQAHIFGLTGAAYKVQLTGAVAAAPADASGGDQAADESGTAHRADHAAGQQQDGFDSDRGARHPRARLRAAVSGQSAGADGRDPPRPASMNAVGVEGVWKFYGDYPALRNVELSGRAGRVPGADRPQRRGQDHAAAHHRRLFAARQGRDHDLRQLAARHRDAPADGLHRARHQRLRRAFGAREPDAVRQALRPAGSRGNRRWSGWSAPAWSA